MEEQTCVGHVIMSLYKHYECKNNAGIGLTQMIILLLLISVLNNHWSIIYQTIVRNEHQKVQGEIFKYHFLSDQQSKTQRNSAYNDIKQRREAGMIE